MKNSRYITRRSPVGTRITRGLGSFSPGARSKGNTEGTSCVPLRRDRHYSIAGESSHSGVPSDRLFTPRETCSRLLPACLACLPAIGIRTRTRTGSQQRVYRIDRTCPCRYVPRNEPLQRSTSRSLTRGESCKTGQPSLREERARARESTDSFCSDVRFFIFC